MRHQNQQELSRSSLGNSFHAPSPPVMKTLGRRGKRCFAKLGVVRLGLEEKRNILESPARHKQCPVIDKMLLRALLNMFNHTEDDATPIAGNDLKASLVDITTPPVLTSKRSDNDELYKVYLTQCSRHAAGDYSDLTENGFTTFLHSLGWEPLNPAVLSMFFSRAKRLASTTTFTYQTFVMCFFMLSMMADDPSVVANACHEVIVYTAFEKMLKGILLPSLTTSDSRAPSDLRWNTGINNLLFVYWKHIDSTFKKFCSLKKRNFEYSQRLLETLNTLMDLDGWLAFATSVDLHKSLTHQEMAQIVKAAQSSDKSDIIDYGIPADRAFLGRVCLDLPEFFNALSRCALRIYTAMECSSTDKVHSLLHNIYRTRDLDFAIPPSPLLVDISPHLCSVDDSSTMTIKGYPFCAKRGVYYRFSGLGTNRGHYKGSESVNAKYPQFPKSLRHTKPPLERLADMEVWRRTVVDQRKRERLWNLGTTRTKIAEPEITTQVPYRKVLSVTPVLQDDIIIMNPVFTYQVEVSLSNDGLHFSLSDGHSSQVSFVEPLEPYVLPAEQVSLYRTFFQIYCSYNDPYNDTLMTLEKWKFFKTHFELVEPCMPVYANPRMPLNRMKRKRLIVDEDELRTLEVVMREEFTERQRMGWFGVLPSIEERCDEGFDETQKRLGKQRKVPGVVHQLVPGSAVRRVFDDETGKDKMHIEVIRVEVHHHINHNQECPIFDELSVFNTRIEADAVSFTGFMSALARVCADVFGEMNCINFLQKLSMCKPLLPRIRKSIVANIGDNMPRVLKCITQRSVRSFDVFFGQTYLGKLSEGAGWVLHNGVRQRNKYLSWDPGVHHLQDVEEKVVRVLSYDDTAYDLEAILVRLVGEGLLLAPSRGCVPGGDIMGRVYAVFDGNLNHQLRPVKRILRTEMHVVETLRAVRLAGHIWERKGTIGTLWWQPVTEEVLHPQATMAVYGKDPTLHFYKIFSAFSATQTLAELRNELENLNYTLQLI